MDVQPTDSRLRLLLLLIGCAGAAVLTALLVLWLGSLDTEGRHGVFRFQEGAWERFPGLAGQPQQVGVSESGRVWVLTEFRSGLSRLEGGRWRFYGSSETGAANYAPSGFVIDGDAIWAPGRESVAHSDGQRWRHAGIKDVVSLVAFGGQAWVLDVNGSLSQFDGRRWSTPMATVASQDWGSRAARFARLARAADGTLWLVWHRFWRFNGTAWLDESGIDKPAWPDFLGVARGRLWLSEAGVLRSLPSAGSGARFPAGVRPTSVAASGGSLWIATSAGLFRSDGEELRRLPGPQTRATRIESIAAAPDGAIWVVAETDPPGPRHFVLPVIGFAVWAAVLWIMIAALRRSLRPNSLTA